MSAVAKKKRKKKSAADQIGSRVEMPHICWTVGRTNDPREVTEFAANLGCKEVEAIGYLVRWDEFVFLKSDAKGRLPGIRAKDIASHLKWRGDLQTLISAMKEAGILAVSRKHVFFHPYWESTRTGEFLADKEWRRIYSRDWKRKRRKEEAEARLVAAQAAAAAARGGGAGEHPQTTSTHVQVDTNGHHLPSTSIPYGVDRSPLLRKEVSKGSGSGPAPIPPLEGGGPGFERWGWVVKHHHFAVNDRVCIPLLNAMSEDEWASYQLVVTHRDKIGAPLSSRKKRALDADSAVQLRDSKWIPFVSAAKEISKMSTKSTAEEMAAAAKKKREEHEAAERSRIEWAEKMLADESTPESSKAIWRKVLAEKEAN